MRARVSSPDGGNECGEQRLTCRQYKIRNHERRLSRVKPPIHLVERPLDLVPGVPEAQGTGAQGRRGGESSQPRVPRAPDRETSSPWSDCTAAR